MAKLLSPEASLLATLSCSLEQEYESEDDPTWNESPFGWIRTRPSRQRGSIGEKLIAEWLASKGYRVERSPDSEADRLINGHRVELKFSTRWSTGVYTFQQFRDQNYQYAICLGVSPFDAHCWVLDKKTIMTRWKKGDIKSQHRGAAGADTAWLTINPSNPQSWLQRRGGDLRDALTLINQHLT